MTMLPRNYKSTSRAVAYQVPAHADALSLALRHTMVEKKLKNTNDQN